MLCYVVAFLLADERALKLSNSVASPIAIAFGVLPSWRWPIGHIMREICADVWPRSVSFDENRARLVAEPMRPRVLKGRERIVWQRSKSSA